MSPYLLLDLAKIHVANKRIPYQHARVGLMVKLKQAKHLISPEEPHSVYVLPEKKAAKSIIQATADILHIHPNAHIAIVSPRKKLPPLITELAQQHPHAHILLSHKVSKNVRRFLKTPFLENILNEQNIIEETAQPIQAATDPMLPETTTPIAETTHDEGEAKIIHETLGQYPRDTVFTLLSDNREDDQELIAALRMLKKNRPKKKTDLVRLLSNHIHNNLQQTQALVIKLQAEGIIKIDAAENVRYS
ncbi:MAG: hypothetical protein Q4B82_08490 [Alysiella sp.]|uniref:hypothetical protein n=1 Tax=Alysiella sp. TaxID=1872483 RepID=UPI0026DC4ED6|nr:hypothetical protein [Alysiella sp.]MDO4434600.1 hypothetical protein [Alysiella sp.]